MLRATDRLFDRDGNGMLDAHERYEKFDCEEKMVDKLFGDSDHDDIFGTDDIFHDDIGGGFGDDF